VIAPSNIDELPAHVGEEIGASGWQPVSRDDVNGSPRRRRPAVDPQRRRPRAPDPVRRQDRVCVAGFL